MKLKTNIYKLCQKVIAWFLIKSTMLQWMQVLLKPVQKINDDLADYQKEIIRLHHKNYETVAYESYLNDEFDPNERRITIVNDDNYNPLLQTYLVIENQPPVDTYLLQEIDNDSNLSQDDLASTYLVSEVFPNYDFIIEIPAGVFTTAEQDKISLTVDDQKLLHVQFKIEEV